MKRLALALLLASCDSGWPGCTERPLVLTGDSCRDAVGTWGYFGIDTAVVFVFHADAGWDEIEVTRAMNNPVDQGRWSCDGGAFSVQRFGEGRFVDGGIEFATGRHALTCPGVTP